ncbi:MAG: hypothetical protein KAR06_04910 [Deltaproteobacteria bacterium]|nr:hypothetical protein [Deltaproteobacteria bacterium]
MEVVEKVIEYTRSNHFKLYSFGDIHLGAIQSAEEQIAEKVRQERDAYWVGMGDYADCIIKNDPRFDMEGLAPWVKKGNIVESQRIKVRELFKPIADKCLGLITGNHEEEIHKRNQNDITRNLCGDLNVPYLGYSCFLLLTFRRAKSSESHQYIVHAWHGAGAAQTEGARLMRLMRLVNEVQAHIYLMGHLHAMTQHTPDRLVCVRGRVKSLKLAATITGSWVKTYMQPIGSQELSPHYGEMKGYKPSRIGCPVVNIRPAHDEFTIES